MSEQVNVEEIMREIRAQILAQKAAEGSETAGMIPLAGQRLPADFYEHLYQAEMGYDQLLVRAKVQPSTLPLIGPLVNRLKHELHRLVIYYVNQVAVKQVEVNRQMLKALALLAETIETEANPT